MSPLSLTCSRSIYFSTSPPQDFHGKFNNFSFPTTSTPPATTLKFSPFSQRFFRNGNWVSHRNRFHAKSADSEEPNANQPSTQVSQENVAVSSSGGNPSTSFLSILCPLLKLFSVSLLISLFVFWLHYVKLKPLCTLYGISV